MLNLGNSALSSSCAIGFALISGVEGLWLVMGDVLAIKTICCPASQFDLGIQEQVT
jgi:hypothetical protein